MRGTRRGIRIFLALVLLAVLAVFVLYYRLEHPPPARAGLARKTTIFFPA